MESYPLDSLLSVRHFREENAKRRRRDAEPVRRRVQLVKLHVNTPFLLSGLAPTQRRRVERAYFNMQTINAKKVTPSTSAAEIIIAV